MHSIPQSNWLTGFPPKLWMDWLLIRSFILAYQTIHDSGYLDAYAFLTCVHSTITNYSAGQHLVLFLVSALYIEDISVLMQMREHLYLDMYCLMRFQSIKLWLLLLNLLNQKRMTLAMVAKGWMAAWKCPCRRAFQPSDRWIRPANCCSGSKGNGKSIASILDSLGSGLSSLMSCVIFMLCFD